MNLEAVRVRVRTLLAVIGLTVAAATPSFAAEQASPANPRTDGPTAVARARVAADVLMNSYDPGKAWFPSSWWNSAVALQTIADYMQRTAIAIEFSLPVHRQHLLSPPLLGCRAAIELTGEDAQALAGLLEPLGVAIAADGGQGALRFIDELSAAPAEWSNPAR